MTFQEAEHQFQDLEKQWAAGQLGEDAYRAALLQLRVTTPDGQTWGLQAHTGRWFVLRDGKWQAAVPTHLSPRQAEPRPAQTAAQQPVRSQAPAAKPARQRKAFWLLGAAGLAAVCLACAAAGALGYLIYTGSIPIPGLVQTAPQSSQPEEETPQAAEPAKPLEKVSAAPDGTPHSDSRGVTLVVPPGAVEANEQVNLSAVELDTPWRADLEKAFTINTPFYQLSASGKNDAPGTLGLSFPTTNPNARLLAVIDGEYLVELSQAPEGGKIEVQTRAGPSDPAGLKPPEGYDGTGTIYYAVITPKSANSAAGGKLAALLGRQGDERSCIPDLSVIGSVSINLCRQNEAGTVQVMLPVKLRELRPQVDMMVDKIEAVMTKYAGAGFTTAQLSKSSPMLVRISSKITSPNYYPANGVLYIPEDTVRDIATKTPTDVYHEMAHWIEAVKYSTLAAYWSQEKTWWLETAAENMVMLVEPTYLGGNLTTYGSITTAAETLAFQNEPYQWPANFYIHAQLLKVNLCDSAACPLSPASFAKAISEGRYPIDATAKSLISSNLKDYAFYLLGKSPSAANTGISLSGPVRNGEGYGEFVQVATDPNTDHKYNFNGRAPQMTMANRNGQEVLEINATLQRDSVYPLMVLGGEGNHPGLPVELVIEPGASFYYTLDDGELKYSNGAQELTVRPIHGKMGIRKVRIVAMGTSGGEVFKARVQTLNLEGAWVVLITGNKTAGTTTCSDNSIKLDNPDGTALLMGYILGLTSGTGDMKLDSTGRNLDWEEVAGRAPAEFKEAGVTFKAATLLAGEAVKYQAAVDIPKKSEGSSLPAPVWASLALAGPLLWLARRWLGAPGLRVLINLVVISSLMLVSAGCFGMGIYGSSTLDAQFDKIEYIGGQDTGVFTISEEFQISDTKPLWKLSGTGTYDPVFVTEVTVTDQNGKESTSITTCTGKVTFQVMALVYKDVKILMPAKKAD